MFLQIKTKKLGGGVIWITANDLWRND